MKNWQIILVAVLGLGLVIGLVWWVRSIKKKTLVSAIMAKDATKTKLSLDQMSIKQLQALLDTLVPPTPPTHPGDPQNSPVIVNTNTNPPPPAAIMKNGSTLHAITTTDIYRDYSTHETDENGNDVSFSAGEYIGVVDQDAPFGGMIKVKNFTTTKTELETFYVPNKAYTITN